MQSEQFDNKIKEAADHHHPPYDEKAWDKMEKLLDKHLPQKKDDRRKYIFFLLFLLTGGGLYLIIAKPWQPNKPLVTSEQKNSQNVPVNSIRPADNSSSPKKTNKNNTDFNKSPVVSETFNLESNKQPNISSINSKPQIRKAKQSPFTNRSFPLRENDVIVNSVNDKETIDKNNKINGNSNTTINKDEVDNKNLLKAEDEKTNLNKQANDRELNAVIKIDSSEKTTASTPYVKKNKANNNKRGSSLFLSVSAGPDISSVDLDNLGKTKLIAGAGLGYTFRNKFTLRTGFYTARKIYSAQAYQYHTGFQWMGSYKLDHVDADCRVYEIPILLSYNFSHSMKQSWFATSL